MKNGWVLRVLIRFCTEYWYIPSFGFLIGMKIYLLIMLMDIFRESNENTLRNQGIELNYLSATLSTTTTLKSTIVHPTWINRTNPESIWLLFNTAPYSGEELIVKLLFELGEENDFVHQSHEYNTRWDRFLAEFEQENLVRWFEYQYSPKSYDRHFYWVNFTFFQRFPKVGPIFINFVRDPVARLKSSFHAKRTNPVVREREMKEREARTVGAGKAWFKREFEDCVLFQDPECTYEEGSEGFEMSVPFFCGQLHSHCVRIKNTDAVEMAKYTIEKYYSVVGVFERLEESLQAYEGYISRFFRGVTSIYKKQQKDKNRVPTVQDKRTYQVRRVLMQKLSTEFELYEFIQQRLNAQVYFLQNKMKATTII